jgi:hypothetical protein
VSIHFEQVTTKTYIVTVPGNEYDSFKRKILLWSVAKWVFLLGSFSAALTYIFSALTSDTWWYGGIALILAIVVAFVCTVGCSVFKEILTDDIARKHGWNNQYPFVIKPNYQSFLHD